MGSNPINQFVLSIAGFDPSAGAGILADIKTFQAHQVYGLGVVSALTFQNDIEFENVKWIETADIVKQIALLQKRFDFTVVKMGLIKNLDTLTDVVHYLIHTQKNCRIIWDPIVKASAGFQFHQNFDMEKLHTVLKKIYLITPNTHEVKFLSNETDALNAARKLSDHCHVLLKGGHADAEKGVDYLFAENQSDAFCIHPSLNDTEISPKHGSGCVLSSSLASFLTLGYPLHIACEKAKRYTEKFLASTTELTGIHHAL
jgi:hydroxymethylpyrimidine/phosphomethylpyrimidine kinase